MNVVYRPTALTEAIEAKAWYAQFLLGEEFLSDLDRAIDLVREFPEIGGRVNERGARRLLLRRFPYGIYYPVRTGTLVILAVFHSARDPRRLHGVQ